VACRVEWPEPLAELETDDGMLARPIGFFDPVEFGIEEESKVFVLEDDVAEIAPGLFLVVGFAKVEEHLRRANDE
jgi:hypothetical protein